MKILNNYSSQQRNTFQQTSTSLTRMTYLASLQLYFKWLWFWCWRRLDLEPVFAVFHSLFALLIQIVEGQHLQCTQVLGMEKTSYIDNICKVFLQKQQKKPDPRHTSKKAILYNSITHYLISIFHFLKRHIFFGQMSHSQNLKNLVQKKSNWSRSSCSYRTR